MKAIIAVAEAIIVVTSNIGFVTEAIILARKAGFLMNEKIFSITDRMVVGIQKSFGT